MWKRQANQWPTLGSPSRQQRASVPVRRIADTRQRQEVAAAERADVVHQRRADQPGLDRLELPLDVLLEAGEDQPLVQVADLVDAAVVVVAAAQDPAGCRLRRARVGQAYVGVERG